MRIHGRFAFGIFEAGLSLAFASGLRAEGVPPVTISVPPAEGAIYGAAPRGFVNLEKRGFVEKEYFLEGTARKYKPRSNWTSDGLWATDVAGQDKFKTRVIVRMPDSPQKFNGTVLVEWLNVSRGYDSDSTFASSWPEITDSGYAWVGVSAQTMGMDALKVEKSYGDGQLVQGNAKRYATIKSPGGDGFSYDIFSQAGQAVRDQSKTLLGVAKPKHVIAMGTSQSAARLVTYINAVQPRDTVYEGFIVHARNAAGAPLDNVVGGDAKATIDVPAPSKFRTDLTVPIAVVESENDVPGYTLARQPDSPLLRVWEVAGTAHAPHARNIYQYVQIGLGQDAKVCDLPENDMPMQYALSAAISHFGEWIEEGKAPLALPRLEVKSDAEGRGMIQRDQYGNSLGGVRLPQITVPIGRYHPNNSSNNPAAKLVCGLAGTTEYWTNEAKPATDAVPWSKPSLKQLYPTHAAYVSAVTKAANEAVAGGYLLPRDAKLTMAEATRSKIGE